MLLLVTIGLVLIGAVSLVIGFVSNSLPPIYISIVCSIIAGVVLVVFSRMSRKQPAVAVVESGGGTASPATAEVEAEPATQLVPAVATQTGAPVSAGAGDLEFPIEDYDTLRVNQILPLLPELDLDELDLVREREEQGKNRATILNRVDERIAVLEDEEDAEPAAVAAPVVAPAVTAAPATVAAAGRDDGFPIADYDELDAEEIIPLLDELDDDELENVAEREELGQNRRAIISRIDEIFETPLPAEPAAAAARAPKKAASTKAAPKKSAPKVAAAPAKKATKKSAAPAKRATAKRASAKAAAPAKKATRKAAAPAKKAAKATKSTKRR